MRYKPLRDEPPPRKAIPRKLVAAVLERDDFTCRYCGDVGKEADHVIAFKHGGPSDMENMVASCVRCNRTARGYLFATFDEKREWIILKRKNLAPSKKPQRPTSNLVSSYTSSQRRRKLASQ